MTVNKKPVSNGQFAAPAAKSHDHRPTAPRVEILRDSTIGKYTFRLRFKYVANGPNRVCIISALGRSKNCAEGRIDVNLFPESMNGYDLVLLRFEPMHRSEFEPLFEQQNDGQQFGLADAA
jgi:hypothetical protein